jgi:TonB family protein
METVAEPTVETSPDLHFLTDWERDRGRSRNAGVVSVALHLAAIVGLVLIPRSLMQPPPEMARVTPLIEPLTPLTQTAPNTGKVTKEVTVEPAAPRPRIRIPPTPPSPPSTSRPAPPKTAEPAPLPEPPKIEAAAQPPHSFPQGPLPQAPSAPPQIQPEEKPKLQFEAPTAPPPVTGHGSIPIPDTSVAGAMQRQFSRGSSSAGLTVGDVDEMGMGGVGEALNMPPAPGRAESALQLLSDPMGVDFRPYLIQVLSSVRRNWFAVWPESAKLGRRGEVRIQFAIGRGGDVPKLVIITPSGAEALDRAAVAGISASDPFPPLPSQFAGGVIRLQLTFLYNVPRK